MMNEAANLREMMTPQEMYDDYKCLLPMNATRSTKVKMLEFIVAQGTNNWRVVGITPKALQQLESQEYKYKTGAGIQRAHVYDRFETFGLLIDEPWEQDKFWSLIADRDRTILAARGEYNSITFEQAIPIDDPGLFITSDQKIYFPSQNIGYRHAGIEREFLIKLHHEYKNQN